MGDGLLRRLNHLVDDVLRRRSVGVAHAEVDDVFAAAAGVDLQLPVMLNTLGGRRLNSAEFFMMTPV